MRLESAIANNPDVREMHYQPLTEADKQAMLREIGVSSFEDLLKGIPPSLRKPVIQIPDGLSELEIQNLIKTLGNRNRPAGNALSFLGAGSYEHFIPAAVGEIISRGEFYTAYTPYQPEASQGTLQCIYEYQSLITELTGLDVSNASHYDGATSTAEAALITLRHTDRKKILVSAALHPHYRQVLKTYLMGTPFSMVEFGADTLGCYDRDEFKTLLDDQTACAIFQSPNFFGLVEDLEGIGQQLHANGSLFVMVVNPMSLGVFKSPGEWGADIAVGEGQPLGIPMQFGGPYLGFFSATRALMRRIPGRLAGLTADSDGKRAYCLTLQAREQ
ncbi:MAG: glycine dehydrogenase, partial [Omnitrophica bacterium GWA2_52_8]